MKIESALALFVMVVSLGTTVFFSVWIWDMWATIRVKKRILSNHESFMRSLTAQMLETPQQDKKAKLLSILPTDSSAATQPNPDKRT